MENTNYTLQELLHPEDSKRPIGMFDPRLRFAFTNITSEDFSSFWGGQPITVKAGQTVELTHHLAVKFTKEIVDKIMIGEAKLDELTFYKNNPNAIANTYRSTKGMSLGVPAARRVWEEQVVQQLASDDGSPEIQVIRAEMKAELLAAANGEQLNKEPIHIPTNINEFADLDKRSAPAEKAPLRVKKIS